MKSAPAIISPDLVFRAFSDRTRLRILNLLQSGGAGETCVCQLVRIIDAPQPKISRHLAYLRRAGLVKARKDGLWIHYRLAPAASPFHQSLLHCLASCFQCVPELQRDLKQLRNADVPPASLRAAGEFPAVRDLLFANCIR